MWRYNITNAPAFLPRHCNSKGIISNFREVIFPLSNADCIQRYKVAMRDSSDDCSNKHSVIPADNDKAHKSKAI